MTINKQITEILTPKPAARPRIYAYSIADAGHAGQLKIGQTTRDVKHRVAEQLKTAAITNYRIELDEPAERPDGTVFSDHQVREALVRRGHVRERWAYLCRSTRLVRGRTRLPVSTQSQT